MALPQIAVVDANDDPQTINTPNSGRQAATSSQAVVLSTEDKLSLDRGAGRTDDVTITRPANTTAYTAGDVIGSDTSASSALEFVNVAPTGGGDVLITSAELRIDLTAVPSGMTTFSLHLYSVTPPSAYADNAVWDLPSGDRASYLGFIDLGSPVDVGSTLWVELQGINKQVTAAGTSIFGYLRTNGAYTPASGTVHVAKLHTVSL